MDFKKEYKKVRNVLKGLNLDDLLTRLTLHFRKAEISPEEFPTKGQPMPWLLLDILKMAVLYAETNNVIKNVDEKRFAEVYNRLYELDGVYQQALLKQDGARSYFTATAFKQFWYQHGMYKGDFARMNYIFRGCHGSYVKRFEEVNWISVDDYLEMMVAIWVYTANNPESIFVDYRGYLILSGFQDDSVDAFLRLVARSKNELKIELEEQDKIIDHPLLKFGEHTPLFRYPMLKVTGGSYILYGNTLLERALCLNLFEFAKNQCGDEGIRDFAKNFESYVGELLRTSGADYIREKEIKALYGGKQTDFLVHEDKLSIMIEVKSIRLSDLARANPTKDTIPRALEDNVIKGIFQGHELSNRLYEEDPSRSFALIVVTYDDLFLGPPEDAYEYYFKDYCEEQFDNGTYEKGELKPEAIFLVSVREFEKICTYRKQLGGFSPIILSAIEDNKDERTKKLTLSMSCPDDTVEEGLCTIDQNYWDLWENVINRVVND